MNGLSTHILDTAAGKPAAGARVRLFKADLQLSSTLTNADGRIPNLLPSGAALEPGVYRLVFDVASYFAACSTPSFYPEVSVCFEVSDASAQYHIPLLISPFGYTTYRGS
jgi:5-hydroxyisourate hydrolase